MKIERPSFAEISQKMCVMETLMTDNRLVPLPRKGGFRPIAIATLFYKLAARLVTSGLDSRLRDYFLPIQHGAGAASAATDVCRTKLQRALENPNHVAVSCDLFGRAGPSTT